MSRVNEKATRGVSAVLARIWCTLCKDKVAYLLPQKQNEVEQSTA